MPNAYIPCELEIRILKLAETSPNLHIKMFLSVVETLFFISLELINSYKYNMFQFYDSLVMP